MVDFTSVLSKKMTEVEEPKPTPVGTYLGAVIGMPEQRTVNTKEGEKPVIRFRLKALSAREDVDQSALADMPDITSWPPLNHDIWVDSEIGQWNFVQFLDNVLGIEKDDTRSLGEAMTDAPGKQLLFTVSHKMGTRASDPTKPVIFSQISSVAHV